MGEKTINVDINHAYKLVKENLYSCMTNPVNINDDKFHHNTRYHDADSIIKNGIMSLKDKRILEGNPLSKEEILKYNAEDHVNGIDSVSVSTLDIDFNNVYRDEMIYDPFTSSEVDIVIDGSIKAHRNSMHYANEYLVDNIITVDYFKSIDVRLLKSFHDKTIHYGYNDDIERIRRAIIHYNYLKKIAQALIDIKSDIPLREMSTENITLSKEKILTLPTIMLK